MCKVIAICNQKGVVSKTEHQKSHETLQEEMQEQEHEHQHELEQKKKR